MGSGDTAEALGKIWLGVSSEWGEPDNAGFPWAGGEGDLEAVCGPIVEGWDCGNSCVSCVSVGGGPEGDDGDHFDGVGTCGCACNSS